MTEPQATVPAIRLSTLMDAPVRADGDFVMVWMTSFRRTEYNYTLDRAVAWCRALGKPLLVFEPLRAGYRWANDRIHRFVLQGMADNAASLEKLGITYYAYVEPQPGDGAGLMEALTAQACVLVADDYPGFFLPRMYAGAKKWLQVRTELVDSNGLMPLRATDKAYPSAYSFRRVAQRELPKYLLDCPAASLPKSALLRGAKVASETLKRWPHATQAAFSADHAFVQSLGIDHSVGAATVHGGRKAGLVRLRRLVTDTLPRYPDDRNHPDRDGQSGLSPFMHFGYVSTHEIFARLADQEDWHPGRLGQKTAGAREGFWGMSGPAEAFLDESITWRELGYNMAHHRFEDLARYGSLPTWALETLAAHADDPRDKIYTHAQLAAGETDDPVWNAAQNQLRREGSLHNYMRMLWGKRIIAWTRRPEEAFAILEDLNNKYGVDGRDPNSYSGILWCFGRYDRPWPEHPIFGKVRMMTSASTKRKLDLKKYLATYS